MIMDNRLIQIVKNNTSIFIIIFSFAFFRTAVADWNHVPSGSMEPTLYDGDWLFVDKTEYGPSLPFANIRLFETGSPMRGDVITFVPPHTDVLYVKRVVGVPGDQIGFKGKDILVNGEILQTQRLSSDNNPNTLTEYIDGEAHQIQYSSDGRLLSMNGTVIVPEDKYFVLGDHRNNSADSRAWGFVDGSNIMGKVTHVAFSTSSERESERIAITIQ